MNAAEVEDLTVSAGARTVLENVSFTLGRGEVLGIVGESGSGKTTLGLALMGLLPEAMRASGRISVEGRDMTALDGSALPEPALRALRGRRIALIGQEPMRALDPAMPIGEQIAEGPRAHGIDDETLVRRLMDQTGLTAAGVSEDAFPHTLSGGQRQRVLLAAALSCGPSILVADEFSTALDPRTKEEMADLLLDLRAREGMAIVLISHDLGLVLRRADRVLVLREGRAVETGEAAQIRAHPRHPYTRSLIALSLELTPRPPLTDIPVPEETP